MSGVTRYRKAAHTKRVGRQKLPTSQRTAANRLAVGGLPSDATYRQLIERLHNAVVSDTLTDEQIKSACMAGEVDLEDAIVAIGLRSPKRGDTRAAARARVAAAVDNATGQPDRKARTTGARRPSVAPTRSVR